MKRSLGGLVLALFAATAVFAQIQHQVAVVNISVPVRVFDGTKFVETLGIDDFEVREDGHPQRIESVYLIRGGALRKQEGVAATAPAGPKPETRRNFVLLFQIAEYLPEIDKAIDLFFRSFCRPDDSVYIVTPLRTLHLKNRIDSPERVRKAQNEVKARLRTDVLVQSEAYRSIIDRMSAHLGAGDPEYAEIDLNAYRSDLDELEKLRTIDAASMAALAAGLKGRPGSKHAFMFFQREKLPQLNNRALTGYLARANPEENLKVMELMAAINRDLPIDRKAIQQAFSDASIDVHFLYVTRNRRDPTLDVQNLLVNETIEMAEASSGIYRVFSEIAAATGGTSGASANPTFLLRQAAEASDQYYLLYYSPDDYRADGKFHKIEVTIKRGDYRVSHREGYVAADTAAPPAPAAPEAAPPKGDEAAALAAAVTEIDVAEPLPAKGDPVPAPILSAVAGYCRDLEGASLDFVCREEVKERLSYWLLGRKPSAIGRYSGGYAPVQRGRDPKESGEDQVLDWVYDYQLVRKEGSAAETRTLLEENGKPRREEDASLGTRRFDHKFVVLGPVGLFGAEAQARHAYFVVQDTEMEGEPALVIDVRPKAEDASSLYGRAWVRTRDGAVLKVEWEPASMGNYGAVEEFAKELRARPRLQFKSEYGLEKNGLRFPTSYEVVEAYKLAKGTATASRTSVIYKDYKYFEVKVTTVIK